MWNVLNALCVLMVAALWGGERLPLRTQEALAPLGRLHLLSARCWTEGIAWPHPPFHELSRVLVWQALLMARRQRGTDGGVLPNTEWACRSRARAT